MCGKSSEPQWLPSLVLYCIWVCLCRWHVELHRSGRMVFAVQAYSERFHGRCNTMCGSSGLSDSAISQVEGDCNLEQACSSHHVVGGEAGALHRQVKDWVQKWCKSHLVMCHLHIFGLSYWSGPHSKWGSNRLLHLQSNLHQHVLTTKDCKYA